MSYSRYYGVLVVKKINGNMVYPILRDTLCDIILYIMCTQCKGLVGKEDEVTITYTHMDIGNCVCIWDIVSVFLFVWYVPNIISHYYYICALYKIVNTCNCFCQCVFTMHYE